MYSLLKAGPLAVYCRPLIDVVWWNERTPALTLNLVFHHILEKALSLSYEKAILFLVFQRVLCQFFHPMITI
jgi:hypothetical protein